MEKDITEKELKQHLVSITRDGSEFTMQEFIERAKADLNLSEHDLSMSETRDGEHMYEQKCRNIISHANLPKDLVSYDNAIFKAR